MNVRYIVKEDEGVVVCLLTECAMDVLKDLSKKYNMYLAPIIELDEKEDLIISDTYKGVAKLMDGDKWDEGVGRDIAKYKALEKYLVAKDKAILKFVDNVKMFRALSELSDSYEDSLENL